MSSPTTNVQPEDLNYDAYETDVYDEDIIRSIPGHGDLHLSLNAQIAAANETTPMHSILELGIGTGLTTAEMLKVMPHASIVGIDFSKQMLDGAKRRLSDYDVTCIEADYSTYTLNSLYDAVVSVIGIHHQNDEGKKALFKKIYNGLGPHGTFYFGDLFTYRDKEKAALMDAKHYHHLVEQARNEESLSEWAHHHKYLNLLAPVEDQVDWLKKAGFSDVEHVFEHMNTGLIIAKK